LAGFRYTDGNQNGHIDDRAVDPDLLIPGIEINIGIGSQRSFTPLFEDLAEFLCGPTDLGGRDLETAKLLGDLGHLAGRDALDVHLGQRYLEGTFRAQSLLQAGGIKTAVPDLRNIKIERPDAGLDGLGLIPIGIASALVTALVGAYP
jgi:hypothetical protein